MAVAQPCCRRATRLLIIIVCSEARYPLPLELVTPPCPAQAAQAVLAASPSFPDVFGLCRQLAEQQWKYAA